ncbi:MAG: insulinase family protein [bacterium]|nr:insulinase family protein [bacterium]
MAKRNKSAARDGSLYRKTTLRNGVRVVTERLPSVRSISIGVWFDVGSRNETPEENGLSHFIEHLVFKGTRSRNARQIASALESVGGSLNAFTSREQTCFTARVLDEFLPEAVDVLADITCRATFTPTNMKRERLVICEEIKESLDNPSDLVHDLFAETFWGKHPLGQPIMGTIETMQAMPRARLMKFLNRHYRSGSVVVAASGSISHDRLVKIVREKFDFPPGVADQAPIAERISAPRKILQQDNSAQTQFCLGFPGFAYGDRRKMAVMVMSSYLGGGMSSVLFQKIREQRGLAYSVYAYHDFYRDSGIFGVYLGTDQTHVRQAYDLIIAECRRLKKRKLAAETLDQVKAQIKGHLTLGMEATSNRMNRIGRQELITGEYFTLEDALQAIDEVTASDVCEIANLTFDESQIAVTALGPIDKKAFSDVV